MADDDVSPRRAEMRRLAAAARLVIDRLVATEAPHEALVAAADHLEAAAEALSGHRQGRLYEGFAESANAGDPGAFFDHSPVIGSANPLAPPLQLGVREDVVEGLVRYGAAYEGPPGHVHGGYVAAAFDEVLGMAQSMSGKPGMTGTLTVRYRRPTPLHTDLRFEATLDRVDGRKLFTSGRLYAGELLTAEAEGLFISVDFAKLARMVAERDD
jgi:acyl-coenzyme A thioesterase PaaI-like protein